MSGLVARRPAESVTGVAAALAFLITVIFGIENPAVLGALMIVIGAVPGIVTWIVTLVRKPPAPPPPPA